MENQSPTHGDLRTTLFGQLKLATEGKVSRDDGKTIIGLANQISNNLNTELKARELEIRLGTTAEQIGRLGELAIGTAQGVATEPVPS